MNPIHFINDAEAIRWFTTCVNDKQKTNVSLYPQQFILMLVGVYDDEKGQFANEQLELVHGNQVQEEKVQYTIEDMIQTILDKEKGGKLQ